MPFSGSPTQLVPSQYTETTGSETGGFQCVQAYKRPTLVAKEVTSVCSCEVPPLGSVKVLWFAPSAHQLSQVFVVWVVVKGTNVLTAADHVIHVWGVVDGGTIR